MKFQDAKDVYTGRKTLKDIPPLTLRESILFKMDACYDENGDVMCLICDQHDETCEC
jgi:hypothetical protein